MPPARVRRLLSSATALIALAMLVRPTAAAEGRPGAITYLASDGSVARIQRDAFGRPHISGATNRGLFEAYGYAVAEDRLWQLELNRRVARGRLAELLGPDALASDRYVRATGYTDAELDAQFARLGPEEQEIFRAYVTGINRYIREVARDPLRRLPYELHVSGTSPAPWTIRDSVAFGVFLARRFGEVGGRELTNLTLLGSLVRAHGPVAGYAIFNDVRWLDDPDAPVTVPSSGTVMGPRAAELETQLQGMSGSWPAPLEEEARSVWERYGIPAKLGSYGWVVAASRSAERVPLLYGGPQMGFSVPEVVHEVRLEGGNGFHVAGMAFAGVPPVLIGHNRHVAWTSTTGMGDNLDLYLEALCDAGAGPASGYRSSFLCRPFETRVEVIPVRGASPERLTVRRSVHGPVVAIRDGFAVTQKRAHWTREMETASAFFGFNRARDLQQFEAAVGRIVTSHNLLYADTKGNIAYWQAGRVPVRPLGFDPRLPLPGIGVAEWPGGVLPLPKAINPPRGYLANWNDKASAGFPNGDAGLFGKQSRLLELDARLAHGTLSLDDMRDIPKDIARVKGVGREARYLKPYLLGALDVVPPRHALAPRAREVLEAWDGSLYADAVDSTTVQSGELLFTTWLTRMLEDTFGDELGSNVGEANANMLIHVLDHALTGRSGVPPSRDYLDGVYPKVAMSAAFDRAVEELVATYGNDLARWTVPRPRITFRHPLLGTIVTIPSSNRATYGQIIVLDPAGIRGESILTLGQSGSIRLEPPRDVVSSPHFMDQLPLYRAFRYKPMSFAPRPPPRR